jgi:hypothetical protein
VCSSQGRGNLLQSSSLVVRDLTNSLISSHSKDDSSQADGRSSRQAILKQNKLKRAQEEAKQKVVYEKQKQELRQKTLEAKAKAEVRIVQPFFF